MSHLLTTEPLVLRPVTTHDHASVLAHTTVPQVRRFLSDGASVPAAQVIAAAEATVAHRYRNHVVMTNTQGNEFWAEPDPGRPAQITQRRAALTAS